MAIKQFQPLVVGNTVDDGTGDYLRKGGEKLNNNMDSLFTQLGDGNIPHSAGAWKTHSTGALVLTEFGQSIAVNTQSGRIKVTLPKGTSKDYNKVVRLRDVWRSWGNNPVTISAISPDRIKGSPEDKILDRNLMDVELVYCAGGNWEYVENKTVNKITTSDMSTVDKKEFLVKNDTQKDFPVIFTNAEYNISQVEIYRRGNLLYYGDSLNDDSDYGSIDPSDPNKLAPLDGKTIRLRVPAVKGDVVTVVTYQDGLAAYRSSYERRVLRVFQAGDTAQKTEPGKVWVGDLTKKYTFTADELGITGRDSINPNTVEVSINGTTLVKAGDADYLTFTCEGVEGNFSNQGDCVANGGQWVTGGEDFSLEFGINDKVSEIKLGRPLESGDVLSVRWFNNDIGSLLDWDGADGIRERADEIYLNSEQVFNLTGLIEYSDLNSPSQKTMEQAAPKPAFRAQTVSDLFDLFHPVGTIYENAHNPLNPITYMGLGLWVRYAEGRAVVGWSSDPTNPNFHFNLDDKDASGNFTATAGGRSGADSLTLELKNIPRAQADQIVLIKDPNGSISIGACMIDPDAEGPDIKTYREGYITINDGKTAAAIPLIQPSITAHKWIRVA
ncbi:baseplate wedge subunit and tail pin [Serratia phage PS2]|uniref:Baseplate wedge protein gp10 n=1 Tax=Serratia phage PS2 TaxID=1481112 RepID=A0A023W4Z8_9CAUD|nr:baseplate wedge subunit [Serratia phage PS2]AHY25414.1 baseplate wedge subunit and tail pin [Serratia phage PS2]